MKIISIVFTLVIIPLAVLHAQQPTVKPRAHDVAFEKSIEFKVKSNRDGTYKLSSRVTLENTYLSDRSTHNNRYIIHEPYFARVSKIKAKLRNKGIKGDRIVSRKIDRGDVFIGDERLHTISFPANIEVGDKVSYSYKENYLDIAYLPRVEIPNINYLKTLRIIIEHPKGISADFEIFFAREEVEYEITNPDVKHTIISFDSLEWVKPLPYFPFNDVHAVVSVTLLRDGNPINPTSIAGFVNWYSQLADLTPELNDAHKGVLRRQLDTAIGDRAKLATIHAFARDSIRFISDIRPAHAIVPYAPSLVLDRRYGDCKDRAYLVCAMARNVGIRVNMAMISTVPTPTLNATHVSQFDHAICAYDDGLVTIFFDPTAKYCEFGNLPDNLVGQRALVLDAENPQLLEVQKPNSSASIELTISAIIDSLDQGTANITLRNDYLSSALSGTSKLRGADLENHLSDLILSRFHKIELDNFQIVDQTNDRIVLAADADLSSFIISSPTKRYIPRIPFLVMDKHVLKRGDDALPLYFVSREKLMLNINLSTSNYEADPDSLVLNGNESGLFRATMLPTDSGYVQILYEFERQSKTVSAESKSGFLAFCRDYLGNKKNMFILKESKL